MLLRTMLISSYYGSTPVDWYYVGSLGSRLQQNSKQQLQMQLLIALTKKLSSIYCAYSTVDTPELALKASFLAAVAGYTSTALCFRGSASIAGLS